MNIDFSREETYILYIALYLGILFVLWCADHVESKRLCNVLFIFVCFILFMVIAFREIGIDRDTYVTMYRETPIYVGNYIISGFQEPLYFLLNIVAYYVFGNFQVVQIFQGFMVALSSFYILEYCKEKKVSTALVFAFCLSTTFFYIMGLNRLSLSISFFVIAALSYLRNGSVWKLLFTLIVSTLFHYSAFIVSLVFIYLFVINKGKHQKYAVFWLGFGAPAVAFILLKISYMPLVRLLPDKYMKYLDSITFNITNLKNVIYTLPLILYFLFTKNYVMSEDKHSIDRNKVMAMICLMVNTSMLFNGAFRFSFYVNSAVAFMYAYFIRNSLLNLLYSKVVIEVIYVAVITAYAVIVFFDSIYITDYIVPFMMRI